MSNPPEKWISTQNRLLKHLAYDEQFPREVDFGPKTAFFSIAMPGKVDFDPKTAFFQEGLGGRYWDGLGEGWEASSDSSEGG